MYRIILYIFSQNYVFKMPSILRSENVPQFTPLLLLSSQPIRLTNCFQCSSVLELQLHSISNFPLPALTTDKTSRCVIADSTLWQTLLSRVHVLHPPLVQCDCSRLLRCLLFPLFFQSSLMFSHRAASKQAALSHIRQSADHRGGNTSFLCPPL
ncbi:hypothetical protein ATANTOWER_018451 [Ataeniobius toweri]|uniref:Uncharacterized protein n=1 Tax=Ataeniobius toweri TaxID=208326 RepID=A0ABU7APW4_9TELE|nr:hypothetical protein [Ataeniobius toweri]